jgi:hypothetical protein
MPAAFGETKSTFSRFKVFRVNYSRLKEASFSEWGTLFVGA